MYRGSDGIMVLISKGHVHHDNRPFSVHVNDSSSGNDELAIKFGVCLNARKFQSGPVVPDGKCEFFL